MLQPPELTICALAVMIDVSSRCLGFAGFRALNFASAREAWLQRALTTAHHAHCSTALRRLQLSIRMMAAKCGAACVGQAHWVAHSRTHAFSIWVRHAVQRQSDSVTMAGWDARAVTWLRKLQKAFISLRYCALNHAQMTCKIVSAMRCLQHQWLRSAFHRMLNWTVSCMMHMRLRLSRAAVWTGNRLRSHAWRTWQAYLARKRLKDITRAEGARRRLFRAIAEWAELQRQRIRIQAMQVRAVHASLHISALRGVRALRCARSSARASSSWSSCRRLQQAATDAAFCVAHIQAHDGTESPTHSTLNAGGATAGDATTHRLEDKYTEPDSGKDDNADGNQDSLAAVPLYSGDVGIISAARAASHVWASIPPLFSAPCSTSLPVSRCSAHRRTPNHDEKFDAVYNERDRDMVDDPSVRAPVQHQTLDAVIYTRLPAEDSSHCVSSQSGVLGPRDEQIYLTGQRAACIASTACKEQTHAPVVRTDVSLVGVDRLPCPLDELDVQFMRWSKTAADASCVPSPSAALAPCSSSILADDALLSMDPNLDDQFATWSSSSLQCTPPGQVSQLPTRSASGSIASVLPPTTKSVRRALMYE